jgi:hypothetical protein
VEKRNSTRGATDDNIIRRKRIACCITKATDIHSEYEIIIAFRQQQWLCEGASMLRYMYIACLVKCKFQLVISNEYFSKFPRFIKKL